MHKNYLLINSTIIELAKSSKMGIKDFQYKGKPATSESKTNVDYWGNPIKTETKKTPAKKPASKPSQTNTKTDFWGNPIK